MQQSWAHPGRSVIVAVEPAELVVGAVVAVGAAASRAFAADDTDSAETIVNPW